MVRCIQSSRHPETRPLVRLTKDLAARRITPHTLCGGVFFYVLLFKYKFHFNMCTYNNIRAHKTCVRKGHVAPETCAENIPINYQTCVILSN